MLQNENRKVPATEAPATTIWATTEVRREHLDGARKANDRSAGAEDIDDVGAVTDVSANWSGVVIPNRP